MKTFALRKFVGLFAGLLLAGSAFANTGGNLQASNIDPSDTASVQRGASYYMSYCAGCHSLKYLRYSRLAEDLGLTEDEVRNNLMLDKKAQIGETMHFGVSPEQGKQFFGKAPPDLSLVSRVRQPDWVYTYLKSFYLDESRPLGWNNTLFPNASMPNPLWEMQGLQHPSFTAKVETGKDAEGKPVMACEQGQIEADGRCIQKLVVTQPGRMSDEQFSGVARDITAFLAYAGEPISAKRERLGVWVLLFLGVFTLLAWLMKREYWKDVH